jgi:hypothetical protein
MPIMLRIADIAETHISFVERRIGEQVSARCFLGQTLIDTLVKKSLVTSNEQALELFDILLRTYWVKKHAGKYRMNGAPILTDYYVWQGRDMVDPKAAIGVMEEAKLQTLVTNAIKNNVLDTSEDWFSSPTGWVHKRGEHNTAYKKRWFILKMGQLIYYKDEKDAKKKGAEQGIIELSKVDTVSLPADKQSGDKVHTLALNSVARTYIFGFESKHDQLRWASVLLDIVQSLRSGRRDSALMGGEHHLLNAHKLLQHRSMAPRPGGVTGLHNLSINPWEIGVSQLPQPFQLYTGNVSFDNVSYLSDCGLSRWPFFILLSLATTKEGVGFDEALFQEIISRYFQWEYARTDQIIFEEGKVNNKFHLLITGQVELSKKNADGGIIKGSKFKRSRVTMKPGTWFGEFFMQKMHMKISTARALENCMLLSITFEAAAKLCER